MLNGSALGSASQRVWGLASWGEESGSGSSSWLEDPQLGALAPRAVGKLAHTELYPHALPSARAAAAQARIKRDTPAPRSLPPPAIMRRQR